MRVVAGILLIVVLMFIGVMVSPEHPIKGGSAGAAVAYFINLAIQWYSDRKRARVPAQVAGP